MFQNKIFTERHRNAEILILWLISFLLHLAVINHFVGWICTDTAGYWLHAATLTGHDWSEVAKCATKYYSWGYSLLLTIPFIIAPDNMIVMSKIAIIINALLCSSVFPLLYQIGKKIMDKIDEDIIIICAFITSIYSSYFLQASVALSEALLLFLYVLLIWLILKYLSNQKIKWAVLSGVCCGYMYTVHHRTLGILIAFIVVLLIMYKRSKNLRELLCFGIPLVLCMWGGVFVEHYLITREAMGGIYKENTYGSMMEKLLGMMNIEGILGAIRNVIGAVWYILVGTLTTAGMGIISCIKRVITLGRGNKYGDKSETKSVLYYFIILSLAFSLGISIIAMAGVGSSGNRIDIIFYGRYFENVLSIFILIGLCELGCMRRNKMRIKHVILLVWVMISTSMIVYFFTLMIDGNAVNYFGITAVLGFYSFPNLSTYSVLPVSICTIVVMGGLVYLFWLEGGYKIIAYCLMAGCFLYTGYNSVVNVDKHYEYYAHVGNYPTKDEDAICMNNYIEQKGIDAFGVYLEGGYDAFSYQLMNPQRKVFAICSLDEIKKYKEYITHIIIPKNLMESMNFGNAEIESDNYVIVHLSSAE